LHKCLQAVAYKIDFVREKNPIDAFALQSEFFSNRLFLIALILSNGGFSLFLQKPNGKSGEKVKSVVFTFSVNY